MKLLAVAAALSLAAPPGEAAEGRAPQQPQPLQLRPKAAVISVAQHAPFLAHAVAPDLELMPRIDHRHEASRSSCSGSSSLCYDPYSGRIVYKPARAFMPDIPGLTPHNISVKRDRIVFRYTFK